MILLGEAGIGKSSIIKMYKDFMCHPKNPNPTNIEIS